MFSMCSELTPSARIPDTRIPQLMQPWLKSTSHLYRGQGRLHPLFTSNALMYDAVQVIDKRSLYGTKVVLTITGSGEGPDRPGQPSCTGMSN